MQHAQLNSYSPAHTDPGDRSASIVRHETQRASRIRIEARRKPTGMSTQRCVDVSARIDASKSRTTAMQTHAGAHGAGNARAMRVSACRAHIARTLRTYVTRMRRTRRRHHDATHRPCRRQWMSSKTTSDVSDGIPPGAMPDRNALPRAIACRYHARIRSSGSPACPRRTRRARRRHPPSLRVDRRSLSHASAASPCWCWRDSPPRNRNRRHPAPCRRALRRRPARRGLRRRTRECRWTDASHHHPHHLRRPRCRTACHRPR